MGYCEKTSRLKGDDAKYKRSMKLLYDFGEGDFDKNLATCKITPFYTPEKHVESILDLYKQQEI